MVIDRPANYGWPFCVTPDMPYQDYDFATQKSAGAFDCAAPVNDSRHNTGLSKLPPVMDSEIVYGYGASAEFPELGTGGIGPMGGPAYRYDKRNTAQNRWPAYFDGKPLFYEWTRDQMKALTLGRNNEVRKIEDAIPRSRRTARSTPSSARTARCTSWSTAPATSRNCPRPSSPASTSRGATARRSRRPRPTWSTAPGR